MTKKEQLLDHLDQAIDPSSHRTRAQSENIEIDTDSSESILGGLVECGGFMENIPLHLRAVQDLVDLARHSNFSLKTPMGNTLLHAAATWYGNDDVVDLVAEHAPGLLFSFNENEDTPLHVAARAGNVRTAEKLLATYANFQSRGIAEAWKEYKKRISEEEEEESMGDHSAEINTRDLKRFVKKKNISKGNTMLHEAMLNGRTYMGAEVLRAFEPYTRREGDETSLAESYEYALTVANHENKTVLYLAVEAGEDKAVQRILENCRPDIELPMDTLSPVVAAIMKRDAGMLKIMLNKKPHWVHTLDKHGRLPLHYAASTGFHEVVIRLLQECRCCSNRRDEYGYIPLHLASHGGHVKVVEKLLKYCPKYLIAEMLDSSKRNILHIAAKSGKHEVVRYILQTATKHQYCEMMINQKDSRGNTPLHLAPHSRDPKTVFYLTLDDRVDLHEVNENKETALDIANALYQSDIENPSMRQQLVWIALNSAGVQSSSRVLPIESKPSYSKPDENSPEMKLTSNDKVGNNDSDRVAVDTLSVVLTLIITASVAACLAVPGETDDNGRARNLNHVTFQIFIICITISLFSSICAIIILFWARLGIIQLVTYSLKIVMPLQGLALISLSLAFLAGIYTIINKLSWLATLFLVMAGIFVVIELSLYILLFLPSSSTNKLLRSMSYYPFLFLASLAESDSNQGATATSFQLLGLGFQVRSFKK